MCAVLLTASCAEVRWKKPKPRTLGADEHLFLDAIVTDKVEGGVAALWAGDARKVAVGTLSERVVVVDGTRTGYPSVFSHSDAPSDDVDKQHLTLVAFAPDGRTLAVAYAWRGVVEIWDVKRETRHGKPLEIGGTIRAIAWAPDGVTLAVANGTGITLYKTLGPDVKPLPPFKGSGGAAALAFSPDGVVLASGGDDRQVHLWDLATGKAIRAFGRQTAAIDALAYSPDGKTIATGGEDSRIELWEASSGKSKRDVIGMGPVTSLAFSPDGATLATGGALAEADGDDHGVMVLWNLTTLRTVEMTVFGKYHEGLEKQRDVIRAVSFSPDGKNLYFGSVGGLTAWRFSTD